MHPKDVVDSRTDSPTTGQGVREPQEQEQEKEQAQGEAKLTKKQAWEEAKRLKKKKWEETKKEKCLAEYREYLESKDPSDTSVYLALEEGYGDETGLTFDCSVCRRLLPARAFSSHMKTPFHKEALAERGLEEDVEFLERYRERYTKLEVAVQEVKFCEVCQKASPVGSWENHCASKSHQKKLKRQMEGDANPAPSKAQRLDEEFLASLATQDELPTPPPAPAPSNVPECALPTPPRVTGKVRPAAPTPRFVGHQATPKQQQAEQLPRFGAHQETPKHQRAESRFATQQEPPKQQRAESRFGAHQEAPKQQAVQLSRFGAHQEMSKQQRAEQLARFGAPQEPPKQQQAVQLSRFSAHQEMSTQQRAEQLARFGAPREPQKQQQATTAAEPPLDADPVVLTDFTQTLELGTLSDQRGVSVLDQFPSRRIPFFCSGEDMWELAPEQSSVVPPTGLLMGVGLRFASEDTLGWGTPQAPGLAPVLVVRPQTDAAGVCHVLPRDRVEAHALDRPGQELRVGCFERNDGLPWHDVVFLAASNPPPQDLQRTARMVAKARGTKGFNSSLLVRLLHEHGKIGFEGEMRDLMTAVDGIK